MARSFNLTAEINLRAPNNLKTVVADIRRELSTVSANVNLKLDAKSAKSVSTIKTKLDAVNAVLVSARGNTDSLNASLQGLSASLSSVGSSGLKGATSIKVTADSARSASQAIKVASSSVEEFGKQSFLAVKRFTAFSLAAGPIYALVNAINSGFSAFIAFDKELVRLQQVTGKSSTELGVLEKTIRSLATSLGVSSESLTQTAVTLAQAGLTASETKIALEALAKTELAPSFDNLAETTEGAIAAIRQFDLKAGDLEAALGSVNAVAAAFAVEADDLIAAIQRTGGVFAAASKGVSEGTDSLNEFLAIFTSVRQTTRESAETIATGLRTIFTRIQRARTIDQLREFGIELTDLEGKFVGPYEAVRRLSEGLKQLDPRDIRFSSIVEELGGFRQIGKVIPLIQQFAVAQEALKVAQKGQGSLTDAQIIAQKSLANQIVKVKEQFLSLIAEIGKSEVFKSLFSIVINLTSGLISLAGAFKPILPILAIIGAVKGVKAIGDFGAGFFGAMGKGSARGTGENLGSTLTGSKEKEKADATSKAAEATKANTSALTTLTSAVQALTAKIGSGGPTLSGGGRVYGFNKGGSVPGSGRGDKVPALLEPQEFVVSRKGVQAAGRQNLEKLNRGRKIGRFAGGGKAAKLASIDGGFEVVDGDTFTATVTPKAEQFTASFRVEDFDAYEINNKVSRVNEAKAKKIASLNNLKITDLKKTDAGYQIGPKLNVTKDRTADTAAQDAVVELQGQLKKKANLDNVKTDTGGFGRYLINGFDMPNYLTTGRTWKNGKVQLAMGGLVQKFARGGKIQRNLGYIDYDVIANEANAAIVEEGMKKSGVKGPRLYAEYLTDLAVKARKEQKLDKLRAIYGVAGSGKTTLARGQGTDIGTLRETTRFPILTPEDIDKASEVLILTSSISRDKLEGFLSEVDRAYTLSSTTASEQERIKAQRASRDVTGLGLEGRTPGTTTGVSRDTAVGEALLGDALGKRSVILGRSESGRLRQKKGNELVEIIKKRIGFTWGGFAPTTRGHESIVDSAAAYGIPPEDFIALVGSDEGITDPENFRTAILDQDARMLLAKAGFGAKGVTVLPKPRDFEVPQGFDIGVGSSGRRQVVLPAAGSTAFMADKTEKDFQKYIAAGYKTVNLPRSEGISGTQVRELIAAGDLAGLQGVLSPGVYDMISRNIGRIQNRAGVLPSIIAEVEKSKSSSLEQLEQQIKAIGIARVSSKKVAEDPEYAAKVEVLKELRAKRDKIKGAAEFEPYRLLAKLAAAQPDKYGLDFSPSSTAPDLASMTGVESIKTAAVAKNMGGLIQNFMAGGTAKKVRKKQASMKMAGSDLIREIGGVRPAIDLLKAKGFDLGRDEIGGAGTILRSNKDAKQVLIDAINAQYAEFFGGISQQGLSFGAVAMQGNEYSNQAKEISSGLKEPTTVSITGRLISDKFRQMLSEDISGGYQSAIVKPAQRLTIAQILENIIGGDRLISDFDKVINYGADVIPSSPGAPMFSEFSDLDKVREALGSSRLSPFGESLVDLVKSTNSGELLNRMFINTARSQTTAPLIKEWLDSVGLPIPLENIYGVGGANVGGSSIPRLKAAIVQTLGGGTFVDDDPANVGAVDEAMRSAGLAGKSYLMPLEATAGSEVNTAKGVLFQNILANLGAFRNPDKQSIDFPNGLGSQAAGLVNDGGMFVTMPTDAKYTLSGPSDLVSNITNYLKAQGYMAGGTVKAPKQTFGTGEFPFPKRISNAYFKEIDKVLEAQRNRDVWDINPKDERIVPDIGVVQSGYDMPFDKGMFLTTFKDRISKNNLFQRMGQFARFIGLPGENLSAILPQQIDFGAPGMVGGALFAADPSGPKTRGLQGVDLSQYGFSEQDKQDVFGYGKLLEEKEKAIKKVLKTPVKTFEDGSFQYDSVAAQSLWAEIDEIKGKISAKARLQRDASDKARAARMKIAETTGRGGISVDQNLRGQTQNYDVLYHELTHQLFQSMRVRNAESFTKYKDRVNSLFAGDNDDLAQAFDSLTEYGYKSADVVYGRSYKQSALQGMALNIYRKANESKSQEDKDFATNVAKGLTSSQGATSARAYRPINPNINSLLLKGNVSQDAIDKMEDNGKEEFLTTLLQYAPKLDSNLSGILDSTLTSLLGDAGIQRQQFADGGVAKKKNFGKIALRIGDRIQATYMKEGDAGAARSGQVIADKIKNNLYAVQSSAATKGYGPKLYDVVMEAATAQGGMLTSDRKTVSEAAKSVWAYYFNNRGDVNKTPLSPEDWVSNSRLLDPKLYGKPETWPPPNDPAWILQTGYSKSPSDINNPDLVQKLADGGSSGTVPAMVSNGEAFVPPKLAKKIGYAKLDKMNQADRNGMRGFASGGISTFKGPGSGTSDSIGPVGLPQGGYVIRAKATKALGLNKGGYVGYQKLFDGGVPEKQASDIDPAPDPRPEVSASKSKGRLWETDPDSPVMQIVRRVEAVAAQGKGTLGSDFSKIEPSFEEFDKLPDDIKKVIEEFTSKMPELNPDTTLDEASSIFEQAKQAFNEQNEGNTAAQQAFAALAETAQSKIEQIKNDRVSFNPIVDNPGSGGSAPIPTPLPVPVPPTSPSPPTPPGGPTPPSPLPPGPGGGPPTPIPPGGGGGGQAAGPAQAAGASQQDQEYFAIKAKQAGQSIEQFSKALVYAAKDLAKDLKDSLKVSQTELRTGLIEAADSIKNLEGIKDKDQRKAATEDILNKLVADIKTVDPSKGDKEARAVAIQLAKGLRSGKTVEELASGPGANPELKALLEKTLTDSEAQTEALRRIAAEKGLSPEIIERLLGNRARSNEDNGLSRIVDYFGGPLKATTRSMLLAASAIEAGAKLFYGSSTKFSATFSGVLGALQGGAQGAAVVAEMDVGANVNEFGKFLEGFGGKLGGIGSALQKFSGGIQAGAIAFAAVSGAIKGFYNAFNQSNLEKQLLELGLATDRTTEAFRRLEKTPSATNATLAQQALGQEMTSVEGLRQIGAIDTRGPRTLETLRQYDITGITSAVSGQEQEKEARKAFFDVSAKRFEQFGTLGARRLNEVDPKQIEDAVAQANQEDAGISRLAKELEDLKAAPARDEAAITAKQTEIDAAQQGKAEKLYRKSQRFGQIAALEGEQEALRQFYLNQAQTEEEKVKRLEALNGRLGNTDAERAANQQKAIDAAKRLAAAEAETELRTKLLSDATQKLNLQTENLLRTYSVASAILQRFGESIDLIKNSAESTASALEGRAQIGSVDRGNERVLGNIEAYSLEEVRAAAVQTGQLAGGGLPGQTLQNQVLTAKVLQEALPQALATTGSEDVGEVINKLEDSFNQAGVAFSEPIKQQLRDSLSAEVSGREGVSFQKLANESEIVANLLKQTEAGLKAAQEFQKRYNDALASAIELQNGYAQALQQSIDYQIKSAEIRANADLQLKEALGQRVTSEDRNAAFDTRIKALTSTNVIPGGTTDPAKIFEQLTTGVAGREAQQQELDRRKQDFASAPTEANKARVAEQMQAMAKQNVAINNSRKALEELANDGSKAANALRDLQDIDRVATGATNFTRDVLTSSGEDRAKIDRQLLSFTKFRSGQATAAEVNNLEFRQNAFAGGDLIKSVLPKEIADQLDAQLSLDMLRSTPGSEKALKAVIGKTPGPDGKDITLESALQMKAEGRDPVQEKYIQAYKDAVSVQAEAAAKLGEAAQQVAQTFNDKMIQVLTEIQQQLPNILEQSVTAGMTPAVAAAYKELNVANKEKQALDAAQAGAMGLDATQFNAVNAGYDTVVASRKRTEDLALSQAKAQGFDSVEQFKTTAPEKYQTFVESDQYKQSLEAQTTAEKNFASIATQAGVSPEIAQDISTYRSGDAYAQATTKIAEKEAAFAAAQAGPQPAEEPRAKALEEKAADTTELEKKRQEEAAKKDADSMVQSAASFAASVVAFAASVALFGKGGSEGGGGGNVVSDVLNKVKDKATDDISDGIYNKLKTKVMSFFGGGARAGGAGIPRPMGAPGSLPGMGAPGGAGAGFGLPAWVGLSQITSPLAAGGTGVFGVTSAGGASGAVLGGGAAFGAGYGAYAAGDTLYSLGELAYDPSGKMQELQQRSTEAGNRMFTEDGFSIGGYFQNVAENLRNPGDSLIDYVSAIGTLLGTAAGSLGVAVGILEDKTKTMEQTLKASYTQRNKEEFSSSAASALNALTSDEQIRAKDEAVLRLKLKKAETIATGGGTDAEKLAQAGVADKGWTDFNAYLGSLKQQASESASMRANITTQDNAFWWDTKRGADSPEFLKAVDELVASQMQNEENSAKTAHMADEATKPGSIFTHDKTTEKLLNQLLSSSGQTPETDGAESSVASSFVKSATAPIKQAVSSAVSLATDPSKVVETGKQFVGQALALPQKLADKGSGFIKDFQADPKQAIMSAAKAPIDMLSPFVKNDDKKQVDVSKNTELVDGLLSALPPSIKDLIPTSLLEKFGLSGASTSPSGESCECKLLSEILAVLQKCCLSAKTETTPTTNVIPAPVPPGANMVPGASTPVVGVAPASRSALATPSIGATTGLEPRPEIALQQAEADRLARSATRPSVNQEPAVVQESVKLEDDRQKVLDANRKAKQKEVDLLKKQVAAAKTNVQINKLNGATGEKSSAILADKEAKLAVAQQDLSNLNQQEADELEQVRKNQQLAADLSGKKVQYTTQQIAKPQVATQQTQLSPLDAVRQQRQQAAAADKKARREAYLSRFRPEVRERMMTDEEKAARDRARAQATSVSANQTRQPGQPGVGNIPYTGDTRTPTQDPNALSTFGNNTQPIPTALQNTTTPQYSAQAVAADQAASSQNNIPTTIGLDPASLKAFTDIQASFTAFGGYVSQLANIRLPDKIEISGGGNYTMEVNITGAAAMEMLETKTKELAEKFIVTEIQELKDRLNKVFPSEFKASGTGGQPTEK